VIDLLTTPDADELASLAALIAQGSTTLDVEAELRRSFAKLWVARQSGKIRGFLLAWDVADEVHLLDLVVDAEHRRQGIARALMSVLLEHVRSRRAGSILLEVRKSNDAARKLYESTGFTVAGERARYYADGEDAVLMRLDHEAC
jgi:ribosomal-protein-alanine N-acetyltransferase